MSLGLSFMHPQAPGAASGRLAYAPTHWRAGRAVALCAPAALRPDTRKSFP